MFQGANISQLERDIGSEQFPPNEHYFGLVNVSTHLQHKSYINHNSTGRRYYSTYRNKPLLLFPSVFTLNSVKFYNFCQNMQNIG